MAIPVQMIVQTSDGRRGVTCPDIMGTCGPGEVPVVFDGMSSFKGTLESDLTVIGPENAEASLELCHAGEGADTCIFLMGSKDGIECQRYGGLRWQLMFANMTAKRKPILPAPQCHDEGVAING